MRQVFPVAAAVLIEIAWTREDAGAAAADEDSVAGRHRRRRDYRLPEGKMGRRCPSASAIAKCKDDLERNEI